MNGSKVDLILKELMERYPVLMPVKEDIFKTYEILRDAFLQDGTLLIAGNGGSCADSECQPRSAGPVPEPVRTASILWGN